ncbi:MAG: lysylphosphatidylglycerol synthase transmembrane domain-containing protein [Ferruginibacter sp.]
MQKKLLSFVKFAFFFGLGIFLVWWSIHKLSATQYAQFIEALKTANYYLVIPVFAILTISHISRAIRWKILMASMGYYPKLSNTFAAVMVGYLANFAFPRLGEVLKCTILGKYEKVPPDKLVGTILVERAVDLLSFGIVIIISLLTQAKVVGAYTKEKINTYILAGDKTAVITRFAIMGAVLLVLLLVMRYIFKKYHHIKLVDRLKSIIKGVIEGLLSIKNLQNKWLFIFHSLVIWGCYLAGTYIGFKAISATAGLPVLSTFPVLSFGTIATIVTPGGIGAYPELLKEAMLLYNVETSYGIANGWLQWSAQFVLTLIVGCASIVALPYINKHKHESHTSHTG